MAALLRQWNNELEDLRLELRSTGETITMPELRSRVVSIIDPDFDNIQKSDEPIFYDAFNEIRCAYQTDGKFRTSKVADQ